VWKRWKICCAVHVNVVELYAQGYSVIWHWIYHLQTWYATGIALYMYVHVFMQKCEIKTSQISLSLISRKKVVESFFVSRPFVIQSFVFLWILCYNRFGYLKTVD
jgi:hypothetical protein